MSVLDAPTTSDSAELQNVLTRYVDSVDGYRKASETVEEPHLSEAFLEISNRRRDLVERVSSLIVHQGGKPDANGSAEAAIHRWWMGIRSMMSDEDLRITLEECIRGEKELDRTIRGALNHGDLKPAHQEIIADMAVELNDAIRTFQSVLNP